LCNPVAIGVGFGAFSPTVILSGAKDPRLPIVPPDPLPCPERSRAKPNGVGGHHQPPVGENEKERHQRQHPAPPPALTPASQPDASSIHASPLSPTPRRPGGEVENLFTQFDLTRAGKDSNEWSSVGLCPEMPMTLGIMESCGL